jgi:hypothetical protein
MDSVVRIISGIGLYAEFEAALPFRIEERCPGPRGLSPVGIRRNWTNQKDLNR